MRLLPFQNRYDDFAWTMLTPLVITLVLVLLPPAFSVPLRYEKYSNARTKVRKKKQTRMSQ